MRKFGKARVLTAQWMNRFISVFLKFKHNHISEAFFAFMLELIHQRTLVQTELRVPSSADDLCPRQGQ